MTFALYMICHADAWEVPTNKGRTAIIGAWPLGVYHEWALVNRPSKQPSSIFYEACNNSIRILAFESPLPEPRETRFSILTPLSPRPESAPREAYFYTSASLDDVTAVTPCRCRIGETPVTKGLLLHHVDARVSCVGEVHLNALGLDWNWMALCGWVSQPPRWKGTP